MNLTLVYARQHLDRVWMKRTGEKMPGGDRLSMEDIVAVIRTLQTFDIRGIAWTLPQKQRGTLLRYDGHNWMPAPSEGYQGVNGWASSGTVTLDATTTTSAGTITTGNLVTSNVANYVNMHSNGVLSDASIGYDGSGANRNRTVVAYGDHVHAITDGYTHAVAGNQGYSVNRFTDTTAYEALESPINIVSVGDSLPYSPNIAVEWGVITPENLLNSPEPSNRNGRRYSQQFTDEYATIINAAARSNMIDSRRSNGGGSGEDVISTAVQGIPGRESFPESTGEPVIGFVPPSIRPASSNPNSRKARNERSRRR